MATDEASQLALFPAAPDPKAARRSRSRMFFALWPDRVLRDALARAATLIPPGDASAAYHVKPERYHLTVAFLGELDARQVDAAESAGDAVKTPGFTLILDRVGFFPGANVAWIGPGRMAPGLAHLKAALDRELLHAGLPFERAPFVPHVTCLRRLREPPDAPEPTLPWTVSDFVLVRSARDAAGRPAGYRVMRRWPLLPA